MTLVEEKNVEKSEKYTKEDLIGEGSYSKVYSGRDSKERKVVLKEFRNGGKLNSHLTKSAKKEIGFVSKFEHKNIVKYIDDFIENNKRVLVLEYASTHLGNLLKEPYFQSDFILGYMKNLVAGLNYLHNVREIIHMDLKPENILIFPDESMTDELETLIDDAVIEFEQNGCGEEDGEENEDDIAEELEDLINQKTLEYQYRKATVKICDFSISIPFADRDLAGGYNCCTIWYRAPECLIDPYGDCVTPAVDVWALGCILYEMCTERPLFTGTDETSMLEEHIKPFEMNREIYVEKVGRIDETLGELFSRMMVSDPEKRITVKELATELGV